MKITQSQLRRIIKEELARITEYSEEAMRAWDRALQDQGGRQWRGGNPGVDVDPPVEPVGVYDTMDLLKAAWEGSYVGDREDMTVVKPDGTAVPAYQVF